MFGEPCEQAVKECAPFAPCHLTWKKWLEKNIVKSLSHFIMVANEYAKRRPNGIAN
jgi:hypothetical protein